MNRLKTMLNQWQERFNLEAEAWGLTRRSAWIVASLPIILMFGVTIVAALALIAKGSFRPIYRWMMAEDSLLELPQFVCVLIASVLFAWISVQLIRKGQRGMALLCLMVALGTFFVAGEEISWGQRIFGWLTPAALDAINHQGETNVHNIRLVQRIFGFVVLFAGAYGAFMPLLKEMFWPDLSRSARRFLLVPPLFLTSAFLMPFGYRLFRLVIWPSPNAMVVRYGEAPELCLYFGLLIFAWLNAHRLGQEYPAQVARVPTVSPVS